MKYIDVDTRMSQFGSSILAGYSLEGEGVILPGRLAVPDEVGARWVEPERRLRL